MVAALTAAAASGVSRPCQCGCSAGTSEKQTKHKPSPNKIQSSPKRTEQPQRVGPVCCAQNHHAAFYGFRKLRLGFAFCSLGLATAARFTARGLPVCPLDSRPPEDSSPCSFGLCSAFSLQILKFRPRVCMGHVLLPVSCFKARCTIGFQRATG